MPPSSCSPGTRQFSSMISAGVGGAAAELVELAQHREAGGALGDDEHALAAVPGFGIDGGDHDVHVGDAAVADEHLVAVDDPVAAVLARAGLDRAHVAAAARLGDRQGGQLDLVRRAEALRRPLDELLVGGGLTDRRQRQRRENDGQPDARAAPEQLLHQDREREAGGVHRELGVELPLVEPLARGLLQHRPGELLGAVIFGRHGTDHLPRERVRLVAQRNLLVGEVKVEAHRSDSSAFAGGWRSSRARPIVASAFQAVGKPA